MYIYIYIFCNEVCWYFLVLLFCTSENFIKWKHFLTFLLEGNYCTRGGTKVMPPIFFLSVSICSYHEVYIYCGYILYRVEIIFPQSLLPYQHTFSNFLWVTVCWLPNTVCSSAVDDRPSTWVNIYGILTIHDFHLCVNRYWIGAFRGKKFSRHCPPSMYVHDICHFALLTDWSTRELLLLKSVAI